VAASRRAGGGTAWHSLCSWVLLLRLESKKEYTHLGSGRQALRRADVWIRTGAFFPLWTPREDVLLPWLDLAAVLQ